LDDKDLILEKKDGIYTIILNRPEKLNALTNDMKLSITQAITEAGHDNEVRVVVISGAGRGFCSGADVGTLGETTTAQRLQNMQIVSDMILAIVNLPKPVVASVNGAAIGIGYSLALACDVIIASEKARFGGVWVRIGLHPDGGASYLLPRRIGVGKACELLFSGRIIDADEADRLGLVNRVVPGDQLESTVREAAAAMAKGAPLATSLTKTSIYRGLTMDLAAVLELEARAASTLSNTEDSTEAMAAFREKREPIFKWR
jgi:enoyl-CoA hydratase/carnithine racemase